MRSHEVYGRRTAHDGGDPEARVPGAGLQRTRTDVPRLLDGVAAHAAVRRRRTDRVDVYTMRDERSRDLLGGRIPATQRRRHRDGRRRASLRRDHRLQGRFSDGTTDSARAAGLCGAAGGSDAGLEVAKDLTASVSE